MTPSTPYIDVQNVHFYYNKNNVVLNGIDMQIKQGQIFALLGANGNGKTTLIKLLVGVLKPRSGKIMIMGKEPGLKGLDVPGRLVGYMPQEIALYTNLTIEQTLYYYGHVFGMSDKQIEERIRYLYENIDLKERHKTIGTLSGGQQRSVSMALTLIHSPELVIWDEPTVGLDPISRDKMWKFLFSLCREQGLTVLMTTHYIEEAKQADQVAFIHQGICLMQDKPQNLLDQYQCSTLEEVSYKVCLNHDKAKRIASHTVVETPKVNSYWEVTNLKLSPIHVKALFGKLIIHYGTNPAFVLMFVGLSILLVPLPVFVFGPPKTVPVGIYDDDLTNLTRSYTENLNQDNIELDIFDNINLGIESVITAQNLMFAQIPDGFTDRVKRIYLGNYYDDDEFDQESNNTTEKGLVDLKTGLFMSNSKQSMKIYLDNTNPVSSYYALVNCLIAFQKAFKSNLDMFNNSNGQFSMSSMIAIKVEEPIHGNFEVQFKDFIVCSALVTLAFYDGMYLAAFVLLLERKSGVKSRDRVSGVTKLELVVANFVFNMCWNVVGIISMFITLIIFYPSMYKSKLLEASLITMVLAAEGIWLGTVLALIITDIIMLGLTSITIHMGLIFGSGVFWPIQSLPSWFVTVANVFPYTQTITSIESLLISGFSILSPKVMSGLMVSFFYTILFSIIALCLIAYKPR